MAHAQAAWDDHVREQLQHGVCPDAMLWQRFVQQWFPLGTVRGAVRRIEAIEGVECRQDGRDGLGQPVGAGDVGVTPRALGCKWSEIVGGLVGHGPGILGGAGS